MPRRRKFSSPEGDYSVDDNLEIGTDADSGEDSVEPQAEDEMTAVAEVIEPVEVPEPPQDNGEKPEESPPIMDIIVIDVEAGTKAKKPPGTKPSAKSKEDRPQPKPSPMPKRNLPRFIRK